MRILLPTGELAYGIVKAAAEGYDADVVAIGRVASFLTPANLRKLMQARNYDYVVVSGMCTASFAEVEAEFGVPIYRGPRHAADLGMVLPMLGKVELSRSVPADALLSSKRHEEAAGRVLENEMGSVPVFMLRDLKVGGDSRMKVLAEIMDAHKRDDLREEANRFLSEGADIIDLGFGFDATPEDVERCFDKLSDLSCPLSVDTQDADLIKAALGGADLVLSLHEGNIGEAGPAVALAGAAAVVVPGNRSLLENIEAAKAAGITNIIADPLLQPAGSGLVESLAGFLDVPYPLFFGAGNVVELLDADSVGANALLAAMAYECRAAVVFTSEHSDKTQGSVSEMRRATEMMALMEGRPYPKDLGLDLFAIKEKRLRREPPLVYEEVVTAGGAPDDIAFDPCGNLRIGIEDGMIVAVHNGTAVRGEHWEDVFSTLLKEGRVSLLDHAAYLGKELYKAELAIRFGRSFEQDGVF